MTDQTERRSSRRLHEPAGGPFEWAGDTPRCPVCGHLMPRQLSKRVVVHTGRSGVYACAGHSDEEYAQVKADRLAEYDSDATYQPLSTEEDHHE